MSQSKISRIERGRTLPTVLDVEQILRALEVPTEAARELIALTRRANVVHTSWRAVAEVGLWRKQKDLKALAESCVVQRLFLPAIPSGFLQVPGYARVALSRTVDSSPARDIDRAVRARLERQEVLANPARRFMFLLTEQAVRWPLASRAVMVEQCGRMAEVSRLPNVELAIVPQSTTVAGAPLNTFVVYDDRFVIAELFSGEVVLHDPKDVTHHLNLFELFWRHALAGDQAVTLLLSVRDEFMREHD